MMQRGPMRYTEGSVHHMGLIAVPHPCPQSATQSRSFIEISRRDQVLYRINIKPMSRGVDDTDKIALLYQHVDQIRHLEQLVIRVRQ